MLFDVYFADAFLGSNRFNLIPNLVGEPDS